MALQQSDAVRNAKLDAIEAAIGPSAILLILTGAVPANCAAADAGTILATVNLPADWMNPAAGGVKTLLGTWADYSADANGVAAHFRLMDTAGVTCHMQGTVTATAGGGDIELNNTTLSIGQPFQVTNFTLTAGNG